MTWSLFFQKDDVLLFDYNVEERVNDFVAAALAQVRYTNSISLIFLVSVVNYIFYAAYVLYFRSEIKVEL